MTLQDRIESAMRDAMRARDERRTQTLRMAMSAAHNRQIELGRSLTDEDYLDVLGRQLKQRRESAEAFRAGDREGMAANE
ncbi:MAG TPA: GatB/YqeY domain-containing protein, partial [Candidatus Limnocylindria bacterium]